MPRSRILDEMHASLKGMHQSGVVSDVTMRRFDNLCIASLKELTPKEIQNIRGKAKISQPVFALFLNTSPSTVKKWETGEKKPSGIALKLLNLVQLHGLDILM